MLFPLKETKGYQIIYSWLSSKGLQALSFSAANMATYY
jgi:hypothetical protein